MTARTKWILAIVALLTANVIAMTILAVSARGTQLDPRYHELSK